MISELLAERVRGGLLGAACGDALGAPFEGSHTVRLTELQEWMRSHRVLRYTDDTAMMIALSEYLVTLPPGDSIAEQQLVEVFAEHWRREPWRGYGAGPPHIFGLVLAGTKWAAGAGRTATPTACHRAGSTPTLERLAGEGTLP